VGARRGEPPAGFAPSMRPTAHATLSPASCGQLSHLYDVTPFQDPSRTLGMTPLRSVLPSLPTAPSPWGARHTSARSDFIAFVAMVSSLGWV
jgi:hypothetical protein